MSNIIIETMQLIAVGALSGAILRQVVLGVANIITGLRELRAWK